MYDKAVKIRNKLENIDHNPVNESVEMEDDDHFKIPVKKVVMLQKSSSCRKILKTRISYYSALPV